MKTNNKPLVKNIPRPQFSTPEIMQFIEFIQFQADDARRSLINYDEYVAMPGYQESKLYRFCRPGEFIPDWAKGLVPGYHAGDLMTDAMWNNLKKIVIENGPQTAEYIFNDTDANRRYKDLSEAAQMIHKHLVGMKTI